MKTFQKDQLTVKIYPTREEMGRDAGADFAAVGLPVACPYPLTALAGAMDKDKKAESGLVHFVLPERIGSVIIRDLTVAEALNALTL